MMVSRFRRTVSFQLSGPSRPPLPPPSSNTTTSTKTTSAGRSYHVRSASLPCRSHPLIPQLKDEINELKSSSSWKLVLIRQNNKFDQLYCNKLASTSTNYPSSVSSLCDGLSRLKSIHESLDDIIQLPQAQDSLHEKVALVEKLLENFLKFVDAYGIFRTSMINLKQELISAQVSLRRKDDTKLGLYLKEQKNVAKELAKLVHVMRNVERPVISIIHEGGSKEVDDELVYIIRDVHDLTIGVSRVVFEGISNSLMMSSKNGSWVGLSGRFGRKRIKREVEDGIVEEFQQVGVDDLWVLRKKGGDEMRSDVLKRMKELEAWISGIENWSEKVFRSLISTRVSLLNVLTH